MKANVLLVADGNIESDLEVVDAAARTARGIQRVSTHSRPAQILHRDLRNVDAVIVELDEHSQALSIIEALAYRENAPPVIVLTNSKMAPTAYYHGATVCVIKPFTAGDLASVIANVCLHAHPFGPEHSLEAISICTPKASLRAPPE